jgi:hypothetical protein
VLAPGIRRRARDRGDAGVDAAVQRADAVKARWKDRDRALSLQLQGRQVRRDRPRVAVELGEREGADLRRGVVEEREDPAVRQARRTIAEKGAERGWRGRLDRRS